MKLVKTSAIALAISAMVAGPVLAQGAASDSKIRGGVQGKSQMQGGAAATDDEEPVRSRVPPEKRPRRPVRRARSAPAVARPRALAVQPAIPRPAASATSTARASQLPLQLELRSRVRPEFFRFSACRFVKTRQTSLELNQDRSFGAADQCSPPTPSVVKRTAPRLALMSLRRFLPSSRRCLEPKVGLVARRGTGRTMASRNSSSRRSMASARLRSWVRKRWAWITITPSLVMRWPASRLSRSGGVFRQRDLARVETQLGGGRELVDVLPARTGGADKADLDVVLVDRKVAGDPQHGVHRESSMRTRSCARKASAFYRGLEKWVACAHRKRRCTASGTRAASVRLAAALQQPAGRRLAGRGRRSR